MVFRRPGPFLMVKDPIIFRTRRVVARAFGGQVWRILTATANFLRRKLAQMVTRNKVFKAISKFFYYLSRYLGIFTFSFICYNVYFFLKHGHAARQISLAEAWNKLGFEPPHFEWTGLQMIAEQCLQTSLLPFLAYSYFVTLGLGLYFASEGKPIRALYKHYKSEWEAFRSRHEVNRDK
jgi:hypothetical protein